MNRLLPLTAIALLLLASAARGGEVEAEQKAVEQAAAEVADLQARLDAARAALEQTNTEVDRAHFEAAKRALEEARRRLEAVDALRTRIGSIERNLETLRASGLADDVTAKQHLTELERLKSALAAASTTTGTARDMRGWLWQAQRAHLQTTIAEKEAQLAALGTEITDEHPEPRRLRREIEAAKKQLAALESDEEHRMLRVRTDEDGRFVLHVDEAFEDAAYVLVDGDLVVRSRLTTGEDAVVTEPKVVEKTVRRTISWPPPDAEVRRRIDHLRQAAKHLREAGQAEGATRLEKQAKALEASLSRYTVTVTDGAGSERVLKAIGDLRQEIQALRQEVRELKALLLEDR